MKRPLCGPSARRLRWGFVLVCLGALALGGPAATTLRLLNLEELTRKAGDIVVGRCVAVETIGRNAAGVPLARVTIRLERVLKGSSHGTLTFRTPLAVEGEADGAGLQGVPRFRQGEDLILFLYPAGRSGLRTAVGLGQGKFTRSPGKDGVEEAVNGFGTRPLFRNLSARAARKLAPFRPARENAGTLRASDLIRAIEEIAP